MMMFFGPAENCPGHKHQKEETKKTEDNEKRDVLDHPSTSNRLRSPCRFLVHHHQPSDRHCYPSKGHRQIIAWAVISKANEALESSFCCWIQYLCSFNQYKYLARALFATESRQLSKSGVLLVGCPRLFVSTYQGILGDWVCMC